MASRGCSGRSRAQDGLAHQQAESAVAPDSRLSREILCSKIWSLHSNCAACLEARAEPYTPASEDHRQRPQFAAQRIERWAQRFKRACAQQSAISGLPKNHVATPKPLSIAEQSNAFTANDLAPVGKNEFVLAESAQPETTQNSRRNH